MDVFSTLAEELRTMQRDLEGMNGVSVKSATVEEPAVEALDEVTAAVVIPSNASTAEHYANLVDLGIV